MPGVSRRDQGLIRGQHRIGNLIRYLVPHVRIQQVSLHIPYHLMNQFIHRMMRQRLLVEMQVRMMHDDLQLRPDLAGR